MKLRYYMRGLGIGVLVTAILMSVTLNGKTEKLSDEEIIARAEELGMVMEYDDIVLADTVSDNQTEKPAEEPEEKLEIVKVKSFYFKPMTREEAVLQMNLLEHNFFAFRDEDNGGTFAVVYRRNDGGYGIIADAK